MDTYVRCLLLFSLVSFWAHFVKPLRTMTACIQWHTPAVLLHVLTMRVRGFMLVNANNDAMLKCIKGPRG